MRKAWKEVALLPKANWVLSATTLMNRAGTMVLPFLMLYLTKSLGLSVQHAAAIFIVFGVTSAVSVPFSGALCDRLGTKRMITFSLIGSSLTVFCIPFVKSYSAILITIALFACFSEAMRPASMAYLGEVNSPKDLKLASALNRFAINLGMSVGPLVGGFLVEYSYKLLFFINALASLLALGVFELGAKYACSQLPHLKASKIKTSFNFSILKSFFHEHRIFILFIIALFPFGIVFLQGESTLPLFLTQELKLSERYYGMIFSVNTLLIVIFEIWLNVKMKLWKDSSQMFLGCLLIGIGMGGSFLSPTFSWILLPTVIWTFGEMILYPAATAVALSFSNDRNRGLIMGFFTMTFSCSYAFGPSFGAFVHQHFGFKGVSLFCFVCCLLSFILLQLCFKSKKYLTMQVIDS